VDLLDRDRAATPDRTAPRRVPRRPDAFASVLTLEAEGSGTRIEMRTLFPTKELRDEAVHTFHAVEGGQQTLGKLAAYVSAIAAAAPDRGDPR
jgi:uncharacterized protein YndB with AHSA1/START domain